MTFLPSFQSIPHFHNMVYRVYYELVHDHQLDTEMELLIILALERVF